MHETIPRVPHIITGLNFMVNPVRVVAMPSNKIKIGRIGILKKPAENDIKNTANPITVHILLMILST